ncbi:insulinase family protein [Odoribacter sp. OttesenSCG-928-J03]|nr:insulinase family protein [Odoribacter sp. OttesenSCG-928-J03]
MQKINKIGHTLDRTTAPRISSLSLPRILDYSHETLSNGVHIYILHDPSQEVFKLDVSFDAGTYYQRQALVASSTVNMLNEGTARYCSAEMAELFDYYGAYIDFNCGMHKAEIDLLSLTKYAKETLELTGEMILSSVFPEKELEIYLKNKKQGFLTDREKTTWLAQKEFMRIMFGIEHPYSNVLKEEDYDRVKIEQVKAFYKERFTAGNCKIILSGNITEAILEQIRQIFSQLPVSPLISDEKQFPFHPLSPGRYHIEKQDAVQSTIRIGKEGVRIGNEDYVGFLLLNTILGGYFGSRLMSNIREEKGYTYGIQSFNLNMPLASYWCVTSDVNQENREPVIEEVFKEIRLLQNDLVGDNELSTVKSYFYGELLRELDGVFAQSDALKSKLMYGLDNHFYLQVIEQIKAYSAEQLRELANQYLPIDQMYIVTAG